MASAQRHCRNCHQAITEIHQRVVNVELGEVVADQTYGFEDRILSYRPTEEELEEGYEFAADYTYSGCACANTEPHRAVFIDAEGTLHPDWIESQGVILDELHVVQTEFAEQAIDVVEALTRTGQIDFLAVDSVPALTPAIEIEKSAEDAHVGSHARAMNRFMRVLQSAINSLGMAEENKPIILLINQLRQKVGVMFGNPETSPGGKGIDFTASMIVRMSATQRIKINPETGKIGEKEKMPVGVACGFTIPKNKTYPPFQDGNFNIDTADLPEFGFHKGSVNNDELVIEAAGKYGVVGLKSGGHYSFELPDGTVIKGQGSPKFTAALKEANAFDEVARKTRLIASGRALQ